MYIWILLATIMVALSFFNTSPREDKASVFTANPTWVTQAHNLGMTCNAWTINTRNQMVEVSKMGIDFLTTDYPVEATAIKRHFDGNH